MDCQELTLADLLADPMTLAVMAADHVDPAWLKDRLQGLACKLRFGRPAEPVRDRSGRGDQPW